MKTNNWSAILVERCINRSGGNGLGGARESERTTKTDIKLNDINSK